MSIYDDDYKPTYEEWDVESLPSDMGWRLMSIEKAFRLLEKDKQVNDVDDGPAYNAILQLIHYVLYSKEEEEVEIAHQKGAKHVVAPD